MNCAWTKWVLWALNLFARHIPNHEVLETLNMYFVTRGDETLEFVQKLLILAVKICQLKCLRNRVGGYIDILFYQSQQKNLVRKTLELSNCISDKETSWGWGQVDLNYSAYYCAFEERGIRFRNQNHHFTMVPMNFSLVWEKMITTMSISMVSKPFVFEVFVVKSAQ